MYVCVSVCALPCECVCLSACVSVSAYVCERVCLSGARVCTCV